MENINNLTPAELEIIRIKREQDALKQQEQTAKFDLESAKAIELVTAEITKDDISQANLNADNQEMLRSLLAISPGAYELKVGSVEQHYKKTVYDGNRWVAVFEKIVTRNEQYVSHIATNSTVKAHWVSKGESWRRGTELVFKLNIPEVYERKNERLKSATTIDSKIKDAQKAATRKVEQLEGWDWLVQHLAAQFPTAVKVEKFHEQYNISPNRYGYNESVIVVFANKFFMRYKYSTKDGVLSAYRVAIGTNDMSEDDKQKIIELFAK